MEDMAAEEKARHLRCLINVADPDVIVFLRFLREKSRSFQSEAHRMVQEKMDEKKYYVLNLIIMIKV